jgi:hypothetical protein
MSQSCIQQHELLQQEPTWQARQPPRETRMRAPGMDDGVVLSGGGFVPLAMESYGRLGLQALPFLSALVQTYRKALVSWPWWVISKF